MIASMNAIPQTQNTQQDGAQGENSPLQASSITNRYAKKKLLAIEAAAAVFADKGFHGATTQDIAEAMGIKQGSLYYYFDSKEQALQDVCELHFAEYVERMQKICAKPQPFESKILSIISSHLGNYRGPSAAMKVHNEQRLYLPEDRRTLIKSLGSSYRDLLEGVLREGVVQGAIRSDIDTHFIAYSIIGICNSWGANLVRDESLDLIETIQQCSDLILYGTLATNFANRTI